MSAPSTKMGVLLTDPDSILGLHEMAPASVFSACPACAGTMALHSDFCPLLNAEAQPGDDNALIAARVWHQLSRGKRPLSDVFEVVVSLLVLALNQNEKVLEVARRYICDRLHMIRVALWMAKRGESCSINPTGYGVRRE